MRHKFNLFLILALVLLVPNVLSIGDCSLDKFEYSPSETGTLSCSCTSPLEENAAGNIVWLQSNGTVLQNTTTDSGACRTSLFGDSFVFPAGISNYTGNTTFETTDSDWQDANDIVSDDFNVTGAGIRDCLFMNIKTPDEITLGTVAAFTMNVENGVNGNGLVHMSCLLQGFDINDLPLIREPIAGGEEGFIISSAEGEIAFQHLMVEKFWETNTNYRFHFLCFSLKNETLADNQHIAYDEGTGQSVGLKTCISEVLVTTGGRDLRSAGKNIPVVITGIIIIMIVYALVGLLSKQLIIKFFAFGITLIELVNLTFILYINQLSESIVNLLRINFWIMFILTFGIGMISLIIIMSKIMGFNDLDENNDKKWQDE